MKTVLSRLLTLVILTLYLAGQAAAIPVDDVNCANLGGGDGNQSGGTCHYQAGTACAAPAPGPVTPAAGGSPSTLQMQQVDLSAFHPDPQATDYFNKTSLPLMKKYIPLYIEAAEDEKVPQNWEILAGLHGPENAYADNYVSNGVNNNPAGGAGGPSGPFQETAYEMMPYLSDPDYGPVLKTLVAPNGDAIPVAHLSDAQFVVLARLAFKIWFSSALGSDYSKLSQGPVPFDPAVNNTTSVFGRIMYRWNGSDYVDEGFNGYNTGAQAYTTSPAVWPGMATTYYLLKQWEANGGMSTISLAAAGGCGGGSTTASILTSAQQYAGVYYEWGGGHEPYSKFIAGCPDPSNPPNNQPYGGPVNGDPLGIGGNPSPCGLDCSGLVSVAVDAAFGQNFSWDVGSLERDTTDWQSVPDMTTVQPGDVVVQGTSHVEIVDHYDSSSGKMYTFGAHDTGQAISAINTPLSEWSGAYRYIGKEGGT